MALPEILALPNLISLYRIAIVPVVWYFLSLDGNQSAAIATVLVLSAGVSDGLDGYLARLMKTKGSLGVALDPICDKIFAAALVILLVLFRDFPIWLVIVIIGRDLIIGLGGLVIIKSNKVKIPSNMTGKYAFAAIALLIGSYVLRFNTGVVLLMPVVLSLIAGSMIGYIRVFLSIRKGLKPPRFKDKPGYKVMRYSAIGLFLTWFIYHLARFIQAEYFG